MTYRVEWPIPEDKVGDSLIDNEKRARDLAQERADEHQAACRVYAQAMKGRGRKVFLARPRPKET